MFVAASTGVNLPMYQIGTDGGYLDKPAIDRTRLVIMPGERATVIIDFAGCPLAPPSIVAEQSPKRRIQTAPRPMAAPPAG